jgi:hypothetical protein
VSFSRLLNLDWSRVAAAAMKPEQPAPVAGEEPAAPAEAKPEKGAGPISYDY